MNGMFTKVFDISRPIDSGAMVYPGDPEIKHTPLCTIGGDAPCNITKLDGWTTHFLTHLDAPLHFVEGGDSLDQLQLERLICPAMVISVEGNIILPHHLPKDIPHQAAILFKTTNSALNSREFVQEYTYIDPATASVIVERSVNIVGTDYLSVDRFGDEDYPVHKTLLRNNVLIIEGLNLEQVENGLYTLSVFPLKIAAGDGSPVRAVLLR